MPWVDLVPIRTQHTCTKHSVATTTWTPQHRRYTLLGLQTLRSATHMSIRTCMCSRTGCFASQLVQITRIAPHNAAGRPIIKYKDETDAQNTTLHRMYILCKISALMIKTYVWTTKGCISSRSYSVCFVRLCNKHDQTSLHSVLFRISRNRTHAIDTSLDPFFYMVWRRSINP